MTQMRSIARQFSGSLIIWDKSTNHGLPAAAVALQVATVIDEAIFSMAVATDPEILLLVEAQKSDGGPTAWDYEATRSHFNKLELPRGNKIVWQAPDYAQLADTRYGQLPWANHAYLTFYPPHPLPPSEDLR